MQHRRQRGETVTYHVQCTTRVSPMHNLKLKRRDVSVTSKYLRKVCSSSVGDRDRLVCTYVTNMADGRAVQVFLRRRLSGVVMRFATICDATGAPGNVM